MGRLQPTLKRWYPELLRHAFLIMLAAVMVMPFIWMVLTSFKPANEIFSNEINWLPGHWALIENYTRALTNTSLIRYMGNGLLVVVAILIPLLNSVFLVVLLCLYVF
jgi:multiple sugar transport system permease protein